jgi:hypothetical protein
MSATKTDPGFYGNDTQLICVMPSGRIWLGESNDESQAVCELTELPRDVESYIGVLPPDYVKELLQRIEAASGESV